MASLLAKVVLVCPESTNIIEAVQVDLTSDESIEKAFEEVKASPGRLDVLINNAGKNASMYIVMLNANERPPRGHI